MKTFLKASGSTLLTFAPIAIKQYVGDEWTIYAWGAFGTVVFLASLKIFAPDERFLNVRPAAIEAHVKDALREITKRGIRLRANVYEPQGIWPFQKLVPLVSCNSHTTDADYGKKWPWGRGLCWKVYLAGKFGLCRKGIDDPSEYGMKPADISSTDHVEAVLCLPIRRKLRTGKNAPISERVTGVLAYDAICIAGSEVLKAQHDALRDSRNQPLLDLVDMIGLYF